jgi:ATP-binding cassette, subfamily B, multidrug efflux pump
MQHLKVLNHYFIKYKWHFFGGLLFVALSTIFGAYQGIILRNGTKDVISAISTHQTDSTLFIWHGLKLIALALISGFFMFLMRQTIIVMSRHIEYDQKNEVYAHYQKLDVSFYKKNTTGDLMNRISEDVGKVRMYTGPAIMYITNTIVTVVTILMFMFSVNVKLTLFVFLPLPLLSFIIYKVSNLINKQSMKVQEELSQLTTQAQESFSAIRVIKAYAQEHFYAKQMETKSNSYKDYALKLARTESFFGPTMLFMIGLSLCITVWYGGHLAITGEMGAENITEFILYVYRLTWPFASLGWVTSLVQRASASQERLNEFLKTEPSIKNENTDAYDIKGAIQFNEVSFMYPENNIQALKNISFQLKEGETLGITGPIGSGKSSLLNLISRQYDATSGEIKLDGKNIKHHNLNTLRSKMGVVPQEVFLFSDTIRNNILFSGMNNANNLSVEAAAQKAAVHDNIINFPQQYETVVGERGITLSGGQKQRVSIARAIIHQPQILIFDDCLSAVDTETEETILNHLKNLMHNKTSIIVSHRLSSIKHAHQILYLKDGEIIERGTHHELLALKGEYYQLNNLQEMN